jgi:hypothetical protein
MDNGLIEYVFLIKLPTDNLPFILSSFPADSTLPPEEVPYLIAGVNLSQSRRRSHIFYAFNTLNLFCYAIYFQSSDISYSLVISSVHRFAAFFQRFCSSLISEFTADLDCVSDPHNRFAFLCSIIAPWPRDSVPKTIDVTFPSHEFHWRFCAGDSTFAAFDPGLYFNLPDCRLLWNSLFTKAPVLVLCSDSELATNVMFSILALMSPLVYRDGLCLWLTVRDPRFVSIVDSQSNLALVATDAAILADATDHFAVVFRVKGRIEPETDAIAVTYQMKLKRTLSIVEFVLDNSLMYDSYSDFLEIPIEKTSLAAELEELKRFDLPTVEEIEEWENSETCKYWRKTRVSKKQLRDAILSNDPIDVLENKSFEQLLMVQQRLKHLRREFARDAHVMAVLKRHRRIVERKLLEL